MLLNEQKTQKVSFQNTRECPQRGTSLQATNGKYRTIDVKHATQKSALYRIGNYFNTCSDDNISNYVF